MVDVVNGQFFNKFKLWFGKGDVGAAPVNSLSSNGVLDDTGVFWLSSGFEAWVSTEGSVGRDERWSGEGVWRRLVEECDLIELWHTELEVGFTWG